MAAVRCLNLASFYFHYFADSFLNRVARLNPLIPAFEGTAVGLLSKDAPLLLVVLSMSRLYQNIAFIRFTQLMLGIRFSPHGPDAANYEYSISFKV